MLLLIYKLLLVFQNELYNMNIKSLNSEENIEKTTDIKDNKNIIVQKDYGLEHTSHLLLDSKKTKKCP